MSLRFLFFEVNLMIYPTVLQALWTLSGGHQPSLNGLTLVSPWPSTTPGTGQGQVQWAFSKLCGSTLHLCPLVIVADYPWLPVTLSFIVNWSAYLCFRTWTANEPVSAFLRVLVGFKHRILSLPRYKSSCWSWFHQRYLMMIIIILRIICQKLYVHYYFILNLTNTPWGSTITILI